MSIVKYILLCYNYITHVRSVHMKYIKRKLFWRSTHNHKSVYVKTWNEVDLDYYAFIKSIANEGFHQIAVNAEMMVGLVSLIAENSNWSISNIDMMEEDDELNEELQALIKRTKSNRGTYITLIDTLKELVEESSLEIKRIYIEAKFNDVYEDLFVQINGLCGVSGIDTEVEQKVASYIEEYMNR